MAAELCEHAKKCFIHFRMESMVRRLSAPAAPPKLPRAIILALASTFPPNTHKQEDYMAGFLRYATRGQDVSAAACKGSLEFPNTAMHACPCRAVTYGTR